MAGKKFSETIFIGFILLDYIIEMSESTLQTLLHEASNSYKEGQY